MIISMIVVWAIPVAAIFGGTAFKPVSTFLWTVSALLAFYFGLMSPVVAESVFGMLPASWSSGREMLLMLVIGVPVLTFLFGLTIHTFCRVDFGVFKLPKGFNFIVSGLNGLLFGILLTDLLMLIILLSSIHEQFPEKYNEDFRKLTLKRSMVSVSIVNRALYNSGNNINCRKHLENLLYKNKHGKLAMEGFSFKLPGKSTETVPEKDEVVTENTEKKQNNNEAVQQKSSGESKNTAPSVKRLETPSPKSKKQRSASSGPATIYGRSIQKAKNVRSAAETRSKREADGM